MAEEHRGDRKLVTILSIDGGGMRGIVAACVVADLEARTGRPVAELFDLVAGTSTGGILALGLACPGAKAGEPRFSAKALVEFYREKGPDIFGGLLPRPLRAVTALFLPKYGGGALERALRGALGEDLRMHDAVTRTMVTSYDTARGQPYFFKSWRPAKPEYAREGAWNEDDFRLWEAGRATSAAPTYFPPFLLAPLTPAQAPKTLVDGGVFVNHPGVCALAEANRLFPPETHDYLLVSVGTGYVQRTLRYAQLRWRGALAWAVPLLEIVFDGVSDAADYQLDEILPEGRFERFQSDTVDVSLDDASESGIERLLVAGAALVEDRREALARIAATLVDPAIVARRVGPGPRPAPPPVAPGVSPPPVRLAPVATVARSGRRGATPPGHPRGGR